MTNSLAGLAFLAIAACGAQTEPAQPDGDAGVHNQLSEDERAAGWRLLFDGQSTDGWRNYRSETISPIWAVQDGVLTLTGPAGGDIISVDMFENFELELDWRIADGGNSGLFYNVIEGDGLDWVWYSGPEYQLLDNERHPDGADPSHRTGANYDLQVPSTDATRPVGEWNHTRVVVNQGHVEHWLNGEKVVEYELWTPEWEAAVAESKFASLAQYGRARRGHIALQDHGDRVWFRTIKVREL